MTQPCCKSCPALEGVTEAATYAQRLTCLPSIGDIIHQYKAHDNVWACHSNPTKVCQGLVNACVDENLEIPTTPTVGEQFGKWK